ncbi:MAG: ABC transporter permease [Actinomycetota bacterium]
MTSPTPTDIPPTPTDPDGTMTTTITARPEATPENMSTATTTPRRADKVRSINVIRSEWIKFWSIRSTSVTLIAAGLATVAFGMIFSAVADSEEQAGPAALLSDPVDIALGGIGLSEMIIGVLGVMFVAGEYSTGLIRTAFASVGKRSRTIMAKVAVITAGVFTVGFTAVVASIVLGQAVYAGSEPTVALSEVWEVVFGTTVYLTGIALIGVALGFILRSTAAGIGTLVGAVFIGPNLAQLLPDSITDVFLKYLPSEAGSAMMTRVSDPDLLSRGAGYAVFAAWVVGLLVVAGVLVSRQDA